MALSFDYRSRSRSPAPDTLSKGWGWVSPDMAVVKNALTQGARSKKQEARGALREVGIRGN